MPETKTEPGTTTVYIERTVESVEKELAELTKTYREKKRHLNALLRVLKDEEAK